MNKFKISIAESRLAPVWKQAEVPWEQLVKTLTKTLRTKETYDEYLKMSKDEQGKIKDHGGFVGGALREGRRRRGYVLCHSLITLDLDDCPEDVLDDLELMCPYKTIIYSTHKHKARAPRLRLVMPLSRECSEEEYEPLARMVASRCLSSMEAFDRTTYEATRLMYFPTTSSDGEFIGRVLPGEVVDVDKELARYKNWKDVTEWPTSSKEGNIRRSEVSKLGNPAEKENIIGAFCSVYDIHSAIAEFLSDVYEPGTIPERYTYLGGSTSNGARVYDGYYLFSDHQTDPVNGRGCVNAFDLVRIHKYGHLDIEVPEGTRVSNYPSYKACEKWALTISEVAKEMERIRDERRKEKATKAANEFADEVIVGDEDSSWIDSLVKNPQTGRYAETAENYGIILRNDRNLQGLVGYNNFSSYPELIKKAPWTRADVDRTWTDDDDNQLYCYISKVYKIKKRGELTAAMSGWMSENAFDPVKQFIESAKWDGTPRVETYFIDYLGADDNEYVRTVTKKMFVAGVARIYEPGCKFDYLVTLVGKQGLGKSLACRNLAGPNGRWFSDSISGAANLNAKETYESLRGQWIVEWGELAALKKGEREQVKLFLSKQTDTFRGAYHKRTLPYPRRCIFIGTTNDDTFLNDSTGARRFLIIDCHNKAKKNPWDITLDEVKQLWAEAKEIYDLGENIMDLSDVAKMALEQQEAHTEENEHLGALEEFLNKPIPQGWYKKPLLARQRYYNSTDDFYTDDDEKEGEKVLREKACAQEFWIEYLGKSRGTSSGFDSRKINEAFKLLGWIPGKRMTIPGYGTQRIWLRPKK